MSDLNLDYFRDAEDKYIIKSVCFDSNYEGDYMISDGDYSTNLLIGTKNFEKKLKHKLEDIIREIEKQVILKNYIVKKDILSEKFTASIKSEEEFNPLFQHLTDKEIAKYTKNSKKIRVEMHFAVNFKPKQQL